jgi:hypothetical protein
MLELIYKYLTKIHLQIKSSTRLLTNIYASYQNHEEIEE